MVALCWSPAGYGYGAKAHRVIGHIAERYICASTRQAIAPYMDEFSLAEAGLWADQIRGDKAWDIARPWHYMNVPDDVPVAERQVAAEGDVLEALERFSADLGNAELSHEQRQIAFHFVVHLVADIHQPLHVGRREDRGGNSIKVFVRGERTNLHSYWDSSALVQRPENAYAYGARLANQDFRSAAQWRTADPIMWAEESKLFRPEVYSYELDPITGDAVLDPVYQARAIEIIDLRLSQAGVRLAASLDQIFCLEDGADGP